MSAKYKVRLDRTLSIDFELTCWDGPPPPGETPEIIQIGISELDSESLEVTRSAVWYVRPEHSSVSEYCTRLTGITPQILRKRGMSLSEAGRLIAKNWGSRNKPWIAWGSDKEAIDRDCALKGVEPFLSNAFTNAGMLFSVWLYQGRAIGLAEAAEAFGVEFPGDAHDAGVDAAVLAAVWAAMARQFAHIAHLMKDASEAGPAEEPAFRP